MLELIHDQKDRKKKDLKSIKSSGLPVVMYGAGSYAKDVTSFLQKYGIEIDEYCIDDKYLDSLEDAYGLAPTAIEEVVKSKQSINIVIGFADYIKARKHLKTLGLIDRVYFIDAPNQEGFFDYSYIKEHSKEFQQTYDMLEDDKSKNIFVDFINAKLSGDPTPLYPHADFNQYFCHPIKLTNQEYFVDCGAFDGDTIAAFVKRTNASYKKILAFEPDSNNYTKLQNYIKQANITNVVPVNKGAWSSKGSLSLESDGNMSSIGLDESSNKVEVDSIDNYVKEDEVTYIKMDIEGAELEALKGARKVIQKHRPKLAICAYHKPDDLITLPQYVKKISESYKIYLRHHQYMSWEMVMYAIAK